MKPLICNQYRYEIGIGTSYGGTQIKGFTPVPHDDLMITLTELDMSSARQVFAAVKGYNGAGLYSLAVSNGVYICRASAGLEPLGASFVNDGFNIGQDL